MSYATCDDFCSSNDLWPVAYTPFCWYTTPGTTPRAPDWGLRLCLHLLLPPPVTWLTHSPLLGLCSNTTFSKATIFLFSTFFPLFSILYVFHLLFILCLFLQECKLHISRIFAILFTTDSPIPSTVSVLCYVLNKYLQNQWINVHFSQC